jgi:hypothetical protein
MSVWYLDLDDEITDAVARLRAAQDDKVILVLPPGSRIGTGRINFRLLAREAETRGLTMALVSSDQQVRGLSASAGLTAHGTVADAERALGLTVEATSTGGARSTTAASTGASGSPGALGDPASGTGGTQSASRQTASRDAATDGSRLGGLLGRGRGREGYAVTPRAATTASATGAVAVTPLNAGEGARIVRRGPTTRRKVVTWGTRGAILGAFGAAVLYVAYLTVPTAAVELIPGTTQLPPATVRIVASPNTQIVDAQSGAIPAEWRPFPLSATNTFQATGTEDQLEFAQGTVRFVSKNTVTPVIIRQGTTVRTLDGREYRTQKGGTLPKWSGDGARPNVDLPVRAVKPGPEGNAKAGTVTEPSTGLANQVVDVTNPDPISGGSRTLVKRVKQSDCEGAKRALRDVLTEQLAAGAAGEPSAGMTMYPASATLGEVEFSTDCAAIVGEPLESFELGARTTGTALEVDTSVIEETARRYFQLNQEPGVQIDTDSIVTEASGDPEVTSDAVTYPLAVTARVTLPVDPAKIRQAIAGQPVAVAKQLLSHYGTATLTMWPDFVPNVPTDLNRITLTIP